MIEFRPATPIEIEMVRFLGRIVVVLSPNRQRFVTQLAANYQVNNQLNQRNVITDKQASFLARCVWRYRRCLPAHLVMAAALKGGCLPSPWQNQARTREQDRRLRAKFIEDPRQLELLE